MSTDFPSGSAPLQEFDDQALNALSEGEGVVWPGSLTDLPDASPAREAFASYLNGMSGHRDVSPEGLMRSHPECQRTARAVLTLLRRAEKGVRGRECTMMQRLPRWMIGRDLVERDPARQEGGRSAVEIEQVSEELPWGYEDFRACTRQRNSVGMVVEGVVKTREQTQSVLGAYIVYAIQRDRLDVPVIGVDPDYRGMGLGEALIAKLLGKLSRERRRELRDWTEESHGSLYRHCVQIVRRLLKRAGEKHPEADPSATPPRVVFLPEQGHLEYVWKQWERIRDHEPQNRLMRELGQILEPLLREVPAAGEEEAWGERLRRASATIEALYTYANDQDAPLDDPGNKGQSTDQSSITLRELSETEAKLVAGLMGVPNRILAYEGPPEHRPTWLVAERDGDAVGALAYQRNPEGKTLCIRVPWIPPRYAKGTGVAIETAAELLVRLRGDAELRSICYDPCWLHGHAVVSVNDKSGAEENAG